MSVRARFEVYVTSTDTMHDLEGGFTTRPGISLVAYSSNVLNNAKTAAYCWAKFVPITKGQPRGEAKVWDNVSSKFVARYP